MLDERAVPRLPVGVKHRLAQHYGPPIRPWLTTVTKRAADVAAGWDVELDSFHDGGWTSVLAVGHTRDGQAVIIKLVPSPQRFRSELTALTHWADDTVGTLLRYDRAQRALLLRAIGGRAGGAARPADHQARVAAVLPSLHARPAPPTTDLPDLANHFARDIRPKLLAIRHRGTLGVSVPIGALVRATEWALRIEKRAVVLHADLYEVNVLFDATGVPVFIDPRGMRGPAVFDWAFWCAFYSPDGLDNRIALAAKIGRVDPRLVLTWVAVVALNGLLHQIGTGDQEGARRSLALLRAPAVQSHLRRQS